jgi:hypothetical protein
MFERTDKGIRGEVLATMTLKGCRSLNALRIGSLACTTGGVCRFRNALDDAPWRGGRWM